MKKIVGLFITLVSSYLVFSQDTSMVVPTDTVPQVIDTLPIKNPADLIEQTETEQKQEKKKMNLEQFGLANRSKDHFLLQLGVDNWANMPDSIRTKGLSRSFNMYL